MAEAKKRKRSGPGRPPKPIDIEQLEKLCQIHCTLEEIAGFFEVDPRTIERRVQSLAGVNFAEFSRMYRGQGKIMLRRVQYQQALKGSGQMLIWLGKQHLDQRDKSDVDQHQHGRTEISIIRDRE